MVKMTIFCGTEIFQASVDRGCGMAHMRVTRFHVFHFFLFLFTAGSLTSTSILKETMPSAALLFTTSASGHCLHRSKIMQHSQCGCCFSRASIIVASSGIHSDHSHHLVSSHLKTWSRPVLGPTRMCVATGDCFIIRVLLSAPGIAASHELNFALRQPSGCNP